MITRRGFLKSSGVMVATFALGLPHGRAQVNAGRPPVSFAKNRKLDGWIAVDGDGAVTVFTGKVELGQGILTALAQIAAEEMDVGLDQIGIVSGNTVRGSRRGLYVRLAIRGAKRLGTPGGECVRTRDARGRLQQGASTLIRLR